jgi:fructan beta-fructosidase
MRIKINCLPLFTGIALLFSFNAFGQNKNIGETFYNEPYRPQLHFSPKQHWMNDPNGMVFYDHTYHLFFQYYPSGNVWGPMHWGHAVSTDLLHWKEMPIALYPDTLGYIFSGSAVVDSNNTTGFSKTGKPPLVAIFTQHDPKGEKAGKSNFQNESIAYSLDDGINWIKYDHNPVLRNPGIKDFRDPKVMWYPKQKKWVMTLATKDRITFYSSPDLKKWKKESEFGKDFGAHGGVWECPDLFPLKLGDNKTYWVLIVNVNPGGPNGGSATQYFIGQFDGNKFTPVDKATKWLDYGPDEYAGVTWGDLGSRKVFLGWMSNWLYATQVPTTLWRSAMTFPRELRLIKYKNSIIIASPPVNEIINLKEKTTSYENIKVKKGFDFSRETGKVTGQYMLKMEVNANQNFLVGLANLNNESLVFGYNKKANQFYIDRKHAGNTGFNKDFAGKYTAPRLSNDKIIQLTLLVDHSSVEVFADGGTTVMTGIFFPTKPFDRIPIEGDKILSLKSLSYTPLKSTWEN